MFRHDQRSHAFRPAAIIGLSAGKQRLSRLLHDAVLRSNAIMAIDHNTQRLTQIFLRVAGANIGIELFPAYG